jgi:coatomer subunit zeta
VYKHSLDLIFYMLGGPLENELMLHSALSAFMDAIHLLLRNQVEKRALLENLDCVILCLDETIDDGWVFLFFVLCIMLTVCRFVCVARGCRIIVETDPTTIASRVSRPRADTTEIVINEQTILNAYQTVKEKMQQRIGQF